MNTVRELGTKELVCPTHGTYISHGTSFLNSVHWTKCDKCVEADEAVIVSANDEKLLRAKGVPERYRNATMRNYQCECEQQRNLIRFLVDYARNEERPNLIIHGNRGTGKTHLMWALVKAVSGAQYTKASALVRRVKCTFGRATGETEQDIIDELSGVSLLVIDEIGRQGGTPFEVNFIFDLIDNRYNNCLPTIIVSNLPVTTDNDEPSITTYVGAAVMDRMNEDSVDIPCEWENWRESHGEGATA